MIAARSERWFDPRMVSCITAWKKDDAWWALLADRDRLDESVIALEPGGAPILATDERLDATAYAFASVIDAKTPFTYRHSTNVARFAVGIARAAGADATLQRDILRAGLLHDIGKLGGSNRILDKPGRLTDAERDEVKKHPRWTWQILERVPAFQHFAAASAHHHERIDGRGYPWGLGSDRLDFTSRVLAIADVYEALTANRPYREGLSVEKALGIMAAVFGTAFDESLLDVSTGLAETGHFARMADSMDDPIGQLAPVHADRRPRLDHCGGVAGGAPTAARPPATRVACVRRACGARAACACGVSLACGVAPNPIALAVTGWMGDCGRCLSS